MPQTLFIADLHLDQCYPKALSAFTTFLQQLERQNIDAMYILGDLFEYWLGDDCADKNALTIAEALSRYHHNTQTPLYFTHGNRDFLLGEAFANRCRMEILDEHTVINLYGKETLLLHGDTLCTDDEDYMRFRQTVRHPDWQRKIYRLPAWARRLKAKHLRYLSKKANQQKSTDIMDVTPATVIEAFQTYNVHRMIHGHTHRPAIHQFSINGNLVERCVVGDWYEQGSVLTVSPDNVSLRTLPYS